MTNRMLYTSWEWYKAHTLRTFSLALPILSWRERLRTDLRWWRLAGRPSCLPPGIPSFPSLMPDATSEWLLGGEGDYCRYFTLLMSYSWCEGCSKDLTFLMQQPVLESEVVTFLQSEGQLGKSEIPHGKSLQQRTKAKSNVEVCCIIKCKINHHIVFSNSRSRFRSILQLTILSVLYFINRCSIWINNYNIL